MENTRELYIVEFESMNYAGAGHTCLAWASSEDEARDAAFQFAEEYYYEQDHEQYYEEYHDGEEIMDDTIWATITSAEPLKGSKFEKYAADPSQAEFYQIVNE